MSIKKLKAGALQMVLYISIIIAIMLAMFIILVHTQSMFKVQSSLVKQTVLNTNKAINQYLQNDQKKEASLVIDEDGISSESSLHTDYWGVYKKVTTTSKLKKYAFRKTALVGNKANSNEALYLEDNNKPLVVVGNAQISGKAYLPLRGIKSGHIGGKHYYGADLRNSDFLINEKHPKVDLNLKIHLKQLSEIDSVLNSLEVMKYNPSKEYSRSFKESSQVLFSHSKITLSDTKIIGHYIIISEQEIEVDASIKLADVILIAPRIIVKDGVKAIFQAIANEYIEVGKNCELLYPSALVMAPNKNIGKQDITPQIIVNENTEIKGTVLYLSEFDKSTYLPNIFIAETAKLYGEIYCENNLDLRGTVYGKVITSNFIAAHEGSIYQNHLFNGKILPNQLTEEYVGSISDNQNKGVAKWLY